MKSFIDHLSEEQSLEKQQYKKRAESMEPAKAKEILASAGITATVPVSKIDKETAWKVLKQVGWYEMQPDGKTVWGMSKCDRCGGTGQFHDYGDCFKCHGLKNLSFKGSVATELFDLMVRAFGGSTKAQLADAKRTAKLNDRKADAARLRTDRFTKAGMSEWIGEDEGKKPPLFLTQTRTTGSTAAGIPWYPYPEIEMAINLWHKVGEMDSEPNQVFYAQMKEALDRYRRRESEAQFRAAQFKTLGMEWMLGDKLDCPMDVRNAGNFVNAGSALGDIWEKAGRYTLSPKQASYLDSSVRRYLQKFGGQSLVLPNDGKVVPERKSRPARYGWVRR